MRPCICGHRISDHWFYPAQPLKDAPCSLRECNCVAYREAAPLKGGDYDPHDFEQQGGRGVEPR